MTLAVVTLATLTAGCAAPPPRTAVAPTPPASTPASSLTAIPQATATPLPVVEPIPTDSALWSTLREGTGYIILLRHALAPGTGDPANFKLDDCSTQRNLSDEGRQQARRIGDTFRRLGIPISRVLSSQWCRCLETARLMEVAPVEPYPPINSFFQDGSTEDAQTAMVRAFVYDNRDADGVIVMVTHQVNITALTGVVPSQGAAVVVRSGGPDAVALVGELTP